MPGGDGLGAKAVENLVEGEEDSGAVLGKDEPEGRGGGAGLGAGEALAVDFVVEVAVGHAAERVRFALAAVGFDVAALVIDHHGEILLCPLFHFLLLQIKRLLSRSYGGGSFVKR